MATRRSSCECNSWVGEERQSFLQHRNSEGQTWKLIHDTMIRMVMVIPSPFRVARFSHFLSLKKNKWHERSISLVSFLPLPRKLGTDYKEFHKEKQEVAKQTVCSVQTGADEVPLHLLITLLLLKATPLAVSCNLSCHNSSCCNRCGVHILTLGPCAVGE